MTVMDVPIWEKLALSPDEVSALTGIPVKRIRAEIASGNLTARYVGCQTIHVLRKDLVDWLQVLPTEWK